MNMASQNYSIALPKPMHTSQTSISSIVKLKSNSLILIGANGSGKTRLGVWLDNSQPTKVHRIAAQRSLVFEKSIKQSSYEESTNLLLYGHDKESNKNVYRWGKDRATYQLLNDYNTVLSTLIDYNNLIIGNYIADCKQKDANGEYHDKVPKTVIDELYEIWGVIFPHRSLEIRDAKIHAIMGIKKFDAIQMSDGERVALYLISQCLVVPQNKIIIIDEPELHLHRSIMNRLWLEIEKRRPNNTFIYITHDISFAASHIQATKIWVKSFDGQSWDWEELMDSSLPEECLLEILGNRKNVLFVEGLKDSPDTQVYRLIYPEFFIVPCGSCTKVIEYVKAMTDNCQLHHLKAFGLIDRDFRPDREISELKKKGINVLDVAEIENIFCIEPILQAINNQMNNMDSVNVDKAKDFTIKLFQEQLTIQTMKAIITEMHFQLAIYDFDAKSIDALDESIQNLSFTLTYEEVKKNILQKYQTTSSCRDFMKILKLFNQKGLVNQIGQCFGLQNKEYIDFVLRLLKDERNHELRNEVRIFLPTFK